MKNLWRKFLARILFARAKYLLYKFKPIVIGVTGSTGKTSTKEAVYSVVKVIGKARKNEGNYNNELGVPLTIIGGKKPVGLVQWIIYCFSSWFMVRKIREYPNYLILELAADKRGDIKELCGLCLPKIGVVTNIGESHMEYFGSMKNIAIEKRTLIESLPKNGVAILNYDDALVLDMQKKTKASVIAFGFKKGAQVLATNVKISLDGTTFKLVYNGSVIPVRLKLIGFPMVKSALAAIAVGLALELDLMTILKGLESWDRLPGRMNMIEGINNITLIDDCYNASPASVVAAIESVNAMAIKKRKVAIFGSMWELGKATDNSHFEIGRRAARFFDVIICLEKYADIVAKGATAAGMKKNNIYIFKSTEMLLKNIDNIIIENDFILIKGSQAKNRLERVVKHLMKNKKDAGKMLVRQGIEWDNNN